MARRPRDSRLEYRDDRKQLSPRKEPYWRQIHKGLFVGYYKGVKTGSWHVRRLVDGRKVYQRIGKADDFADADGETIFSYEQAVKRAMSDDRAKPATPEGKYTVQQAVDDYLDDLKARSPRGYRDAQLRYDHHVIPNLGKRPVASLTREQLRRWHHGIATIKSDSENAGDPDALRKRRNTANRNLAALKAALNFAYHEGRVSDRSAWEQVKPFRQVDAPRIRSLSAIQARKIVNASSTEFRPLVRAALLTGARYGEIAALRAGAFDPDSETVTIHEGKTGKIRHVPLTPEGVHFFTLHTADLKSNELVFRRENGEPWRKSDQIRPMKAASEAAEIEPAVSFHILRHTYGSLLARKGVSLQVISEAMGHSDTRMTQRHYAHLQPDHVAREVRKNLPTFIRKDSKVARLA